MPELFSTHRSEQATSEEDLIANLYQQIGQLKVQVAWLGEKIKSTALKPNECSVKYLSTDATQTKHLDRE